MSLKRLKHQFAELIDDAFEVPGLTDLERLKLVFYIGLIAASKLAGLKKKMEASKSKEVKSESSK